MKSLEQDTKIPTRVRVVSENDDTIRCRWHIGDTFEIKEIKPCDVLNDPTSRGCKAKCLGRLVLKGYGNDSRCYGYGYATDPDRLKYPFIFE